MVLLAAAIGTAKADNALISFSGGGNATSGSDQLYGWEFDVLAPIDVTSLGVGDTNSDGLVISHDVGIFRLSDQSLLFSATVPSGTSGILDNGFRYVTLGSSQALTPDRYVIAMTMPQQNGDTQSIGNTSVTTAPQIKYITSRFDGGSTLAFPTTAGAFAEGMFGPNFQFTAGSNSVPEPGALALALGLAVPGGAALIWRRRA